MQAKENLWIYFKTEESVSSLAFYGVGQRSAVYWMMMMMSLYATFCCVQLRKRRSVFFVDSVQTGF